MSKIKLTKEDAQKMMKVKGKISGSLFKPFYQFILDRKGEEGVKEVEEKLKELGYPMDIGKTSSFSWYPYPLAILITLVILEVLDWDESKVFDLAYEVPTQSIVVKLLMRYLSLEQVIKESQKYWRRHYDFGEIKCVEYNKEKKYLIMRYVGFAKVHPVENDINRGYLKKLAEITTKSKNVKVEQTKSLFNNDPYHEFKIFW